MQPALSSGRLECAERAGADAFPPCLGVHRRHPRISGRFFCKTTFGTEELAERACVIIQETLENAIKYSTDSPDSELELKIATEGERIVFSVSSLPDPAHADMLRRELTGLHALEPKEAYFQAFQRASREPDAAARLGLARVRYEGNVELSLNEEEGGRIRITATGKL